MCVCVCAGGRGARGGGGRVIGKGTSRAARLSADLKAAQHGQRALLVPVALLQAAEERGWRFNPLPPTTRSAKVPTAGHNPTKTCCGRRPCNRLQLGLARQCAAVHTHSAAWALRQGIFSCGSLPAAKHLQRDRTNGGPQRWQQQVQPFHCPCLLLLLLFLHVLGNL